MSLEECDNNSAQDGLLNGTYDAILFVSEDVRPKVSYDVLIKAPPYCLVPAAHPFAQRTSVSMADIASQPLVVLNRPVASEYYRGLFDSLGPSPQVAAYATSTEMVRSLVSAGHGCAILNMRPMTSLTYGGVEVVELPISDPLPPLTLSIGYDTTRPRRLVRHFAKACRDHFATQGPTQCIASALDTHGT